MKQGVCVNCAHVYRPELESYLCRFASAPIEVESVDPVSGEKNYKGIDYSQGRGFNGIFFPFCKLVNGEGQCQNFEEKPPRRRGWLTIFRRK